MKNSSKKTECQLRRDKRNEEIRQTYLRYIAVVKKGEAIQLLMEKYGIFSRQTIYSIIKPKQK